ncbi:unnamed protein product [Adineta steineri]|uniref:Uncharacterized protein n=1 Tax=Adineta steineri TaxID=433720 RepID=A0A814BRG5_9BILA|nr:unnamed protein product [Adineta steineri]CAF3728805.1 unnamed protein product [Adineta steineri]
MGIIFPTKIRRICTLYNESSARVVVIGLDSSGKTTLVQRFKNLVDLQFNLNASFIQHFITEPTFVYQVETIYPRLAPLALTLWDLGGEEKTRTLWRFYLTGVQGVVFVIDCDDKERIAFAREELLKLSKQIGQSSSIPIIIAANKQDIIKSLCKEELILALSLPKITSNEWKVFEISAQTGGGVMEMFCHLSETIHKHQ